ncbi:rhamnogalacturonan acetylesterase [Gracilibacillus kekensis]|uniref:Lysophospholipase L1 n=1 Tax=Gracilibacillus kekensis TaxID=1027249 RepID=A0A1M7KUK9_9BACI|nr:rhamnogalacturonan acetylesterase [Gracilibacillus kekensis]SHM69247.1 Lysophospholipase L1 [Gracilibacillus kekensis]
MQLLLAGDSTMEKVEDSKYPRMGWGQVLSQYFTNDIQVKNHAASGRSTKSFISEGRWDRLEQDSKKGDYVLIQFGHNDQKQDRERATEPFTSYQDNLRFFISRAHSFDITPILLTSIARRHFDKEGNLLETHGVYPQAVRELAKEENIVCIDMLARTREVLQQAGDEQSKQWFMRLEPGEYRAYPDGEKDDTHLSEKGAHQHCHIFVRELIRLGHPIAHFATGNGVSS